VSFVLLAIGLVILVIGAEATVRAACRLALLLGISPLIIGLTVVAFGTSAPELAVNVQAAWTGASDLAVGNVVGSSIFNVLFVLGVSAIIVPLSVARQLVRFDVPVMIVAALLAGAVCYDGEITRLEGAVFLGLLVIYLVVLGFLGRRPPGTEDEMPADALPPRAHRLRKSVLDALLLIAGIAGLVLGARLLVIGGVQIAETLGISQIVVGLTVVAIGTSLPEIATSIVASLRGQRDIAVGNVVGSNIFNVFAVLGGSALVAPQGIPVAESVIAFDLPIMIGVSFLCMPIFFSQAIISRLEGFLFFALYVVYTTLIVMGALALPQAVTLNPWFAFGVIPGMLLLFGIIALLSRSSSPEASETQPMEFRKLLKLIRLVVTAIVGSVVLLAGLAMLFTPGQGILTILLGLGILATEFPWAARLLKRMKAKAKAAAAGMRSRSRQEDGDPADDVPDANTSVNDPRKE
jgi:cation:H+ antiporter